MIEEIKVILDAIGNVGEMGIWLVLAFFVYKLATLASVLLVVKIAIQKLHNWGITKKIVAIDKTVVLKLEDHIITATADRNAETFKRILDKAKISTHNYLHASDLELLEAAVDHMLKERNK